MGEGSPPRGDVCARAATIELEVGGMHCPSCAALIEDTLVACPGVTTAVVDLTTGRASVAFGAGAVFLDDLCAAVVSAGYSAAPASAGHSASSC